MEKIEPVMDPMSDLPGAASPFGKQGTAPSAGTQDLGVDLGNALGSGLGGAFGGADSERALAEMTAKHAELSDAFLRAKAEAENIRRRGEEDISKARKYAVESFAESLLPVRDSLEAAIVNQHATPEQMLEGVHATLRQLVSALERNKVSEINPPASTKFDPHQHQAISVVPAEQEPNTVVSVLQKGYLISDRVLRPALVTVAAAR